MIFTCLFLAILACERTSIPFGSDQECTEEVSYTNQIASIMNTSCAYSGCHDAGAAVGDFTNYLSLKPYLNADQFVKRVVTLADMPPPYTMDGHPKELTKEQLELIECWIKSNYAE